MWVRPVNMGAHWLFCLVSIHAPVWVRRKSRGTALKASLFQFTHPCGCDPYRRHGLAQDGVFQFTHPCGCDQHDTVISVFIYCFNSRTRVGATAGFKSWKGGGHVSIHAPVWVRLCHPCPTGPGVNVSIHAPVWVRLCHPCPTGPGVNVSIHAPVWVRLERQ